MSEHHVKVDNYGDDDAECLVIEIGSYCLSIDHDEAEACAAAINARIDDAVRDLDNRLHVERLASEAITQERNEARKALADRDAAWERAMAAQYRPDYIFSRYEWLASINDARKLIDAESNPQHLPTSDEESNRPEEDKS